MAGTISPRALTVEVASYTGTAAALALDCGRVPFACFFFNMTDGDAGFFWIQGMATNQAMTFATTANGAAVWTATTSCVSILDGSAGTGIGIQIGTNSIVNESAKAYQGWIF